MRSFNAKYVCPFDAGSDRGSSCKNVPQQATWAGGGSRRKSCASACSCCYLRQVCGMLTISLPGGLPAASCSHKLFAFRELNCRGSPRGYWVLSGQATKPLADSLSLTSLIGEKKILVLWKSLVIYISFDKHIFFIAFPFFFFFKSHSFALDIFIFKMFINEFKNIYKTYNIYHSFSF